MAEKIIKIESFIEGELFRWCTYLRQQSIQNVLTTLTSTLWWDRIAVDISMLPEPKQKTWIINLQKVIELERNIDLNVKQQIKNAAQRTKVEIAILEVKNTGGENND